MEIRTGSSDSNNSRHESSSFESIQQRSNESQYGRKKLSGVKRELEEKGISFLRKIRARGTQFEPEKAENITTAPTSKSKQGQAARIPEAEVVNNRIGRRGKEGRTAIRIGTYGSSTGDMHIAKSLIGTLFAD
ncbi:uncharacterized protein TNCV_3697451 [Trichonephila clavipes]|uniref:Uncharacterized protein n=1 Tax=Trichonephila clavipes TaxID=2585209 RepID=A0A8X6SMT3_TRICX|nr:uncharacterized protein TNCV_3697451 [Trichonephila clavipes]